MTKHGWPGQAACQATGLLLLSDSLRRRAAAEEPGVIEACGRAVADKPMRRNVGQAASLRHPPFHSPDA